ncbi:MAG: hypothetical protein KIS92_21005 [Planctomycetota bacterium]|nr:hypothetical protein [Planctomycetota bacterium]
MTAIVSQTKNAPDLRAFAEIDLGSKIGQLRAAPVNLGPGAPKAVLAAYCADFDVDPYIEMFFFPSDTLKLALFTETGEVLWRRDLGRAVVPGMWFCPVFPFDLDGDGVDEIFFVNNLDPQHPLGLSSYRLERLDAATGRTTGQWPWINRNAHENLSHTYRHFVFGGMAGSERVLVTAQGTYEDMHLQGWRPDLSPRWETKIGKHDPGARGSHKCPITDFDGDGIEEVMWGERCIRLSDGKELFCADRESYRGHSDVIDPVIDRATGRWFFYTCRESDHQAAPRVCLYDHQGRRVWGALDHGHIDMGWCARLGDRGEHVSMAIRIGKKTCGPDGRFHQGMEEFTYETLTGKELKLPFSVYRTVPVDFDGDGLHELVRGIASGNGEALDRNGRVLAQLGAPVALAQKFTGRPGEQVLAYYPGGHVRIWGDARAEDSDAARARYAHPFYAANARLTSTGSNLGTLAGL